MVGKNSPQGPATGETEQMGMGHPAALATDDFELALLL
jgi:hypothetical protein